MSYCRFSDGDLYAYDSFQGGVQFYVAGGFDKSLNRLCATYGEAYLYAKELRDEHGLDVPDHAIEALKEDALEEFDRLAGPDGAVAELVAENAKLRELAAEMYPYAKEFLKEGVMLGCIDSKSHDWYLQLRELGIEVDA